MSNISSEQQIIRDHEVVDKYTHWVGRMVESGEWDNALTRNTLAINDLYDQLQEDYPQELDFRVKLLGSFYGSVALSFVQTMYGRDEHDARLYSGSLERDALSTYHSGRHTLNFIKGMFRYGTAMNNIAIANNELDDEGHPPYDEDYFLRAPLIGGTHDGVMGNGRGHDERQAGLFGASLMMMLGGTLTPDRSIAAAAEATTWDMENQRQLIREGEDYPLYRKAARASDFLANLEPTGVYDGVACVIPEDMTKQQHGRLLTVVAADRGFDLVAASMAERMEFVDSSDELGALYGRQLQGQVGFQKKLPVLLGPEVHEHFSGAPNLDFTEYLSREYNGGTKGFSAVRVLEEARAYALDEARACAQAAA